MKINLKRQIGKLSSKTSIETVLSEALTNSIHAGAKQIRVTVSREKTIFSGKESDGDDKGEFISSILVEDDGVGFIPENIGSFCEYGSDYKAELGCKGVGRLTFLKVFSLVKIESSTKDSRVSFEFTNSFTEDDVTVVKQPRKVTGTSISMEETRGAYKDRKTDILAVISALRFHLMPLMFLQKQKGNIEIVFKFESGEEIGSVRTTEIPEFKTSTFFLTESQTKIKQEVEFTLYYYVKETSGVSTLEAHHVANSLTVSSFRKFDLPLTARPDSEIIFLLASKYFDERVNESRDDFEIFPLREDYISYFSWSRINGKLSDEISRILNVAFDGIEDEHKLFVAQVKRQHLHLSKYLNLNPLSGSEGAKKAVRRAGREYLKDKTDFVQDLDSGKISPEKAIERASEFSGRELIEYVQMRDRIITQLERMGAEKEKREAIIHDHICTQGESGGFIDPKINNLWLIDDRFMGYSYAASDKQIRKILKDVIGDDASSECSKEPDFSVFFRNENDNHNGVIIELKPFDGDAKKKFAGLYQLRTYAQEFRDNHGLEQIWYYLITDIDEDFESALKGDDYSPLFSTREKIYFRYFKELGLYLYVMSLDSLVADARARNRTFIDLIEKNLD